VTADCPFRLHILFTQGGRCPGLRDSQAVRLKISQSEDAGFRVYFAFPIGVLKPLT